MSFAGHVSLLVGPWLTANGTYVPVAEVFMC